MSDAVAEIAGMAASWVVDEGLEYGPAKRRAAKQLGLGGRVPLPSNEALEDAVVEYISLFCAETQAVELAALRRLALSWMNRLAAFRPHLSGAVWRGTATRHSDIYLQLFCDDPKSAEIALIDHGVSYETGMLPGLHGKPVDTLSVGALSPELGFQGKEVDTLSVHAFCTELNEDIGVHLMIHDFDDMRGALQADAKGRSPRGDAAALKRLLSWVPV